MLTNEKFANLMLRVDRNEILLDAEYQSLSRHLAALGNPHLGFANSDEEATFDELRKTHKLDQALPRAQNKSYHKLRKWSQAIKDQKSWVQEEAEALHKLNMYNYSTEMVHMISQKFNPAHTEEQRNHIKSKLELGNNEFSKFLAEGFADKPTRDVKKAFASKLTKTPKLVDSDKFGPTAESFNKFMPSNHADRLPHHWARGVETLEEYGVWREYEIEQAELRDEFNAATDPCHPDYSPPSELEVDDDGNVKVLA